MRRALWVLLPALLAAAPALAELSVTYRQGVSPTAAYDGGVDTNVVHGGDAPFDPDATYDKLTFVKIGGNPINEEGLLKFDVSALPTGATVTSVSLALDVTNASSDSYDFFTLKQDWTPSEATWNLVRTGTSWNVAGAQGAGSDYVATAVTSITPTAIGATTLVLPVSANALVQGWATTPSGNHGLIVSNLATNDGFAFASADSPDASTHPLLTVNYTPSGGGATKSISFQNGLQPTATYAGGVDTTIANGADAKDRPNGKGDLVVGGLPVTDQSGTYYGQSAPLLKFDLAGIPSTARVDSAQLELYILNAGPASATYPMYALDRGWSEAAATWNTTDGGVAWQVPGVLGAGDHDGVSVGTFRGPLMGAAVFPLNDAGISTVQDWVTGARPNYGLVIQNYAAPSQSITISARENKTSPHPGFTVTYVEGGLTFADDVVGLSPNFVSPPLTVVRADGVGGVTGLSASTVTVRASTASGQLSLSADGGFGAAVDLSFAAQQAQSQPFYFRDGQRETVFLTADAGDAYDAVVSAAIVVAPVDGGVLRADSGTGEAPGHTQSSTFGWGCGVAPGGLAGLALLGAAMLLLRRLRPA